MAETVVTRVIEIDVRASAAAQQHVAQIAQSMRGVEEHTKKASSGLKAFADQALSAGKAFLAAFAVNKLTEWALALNDVNDAQKMLIARMTQVTGTLGGANTAFAEIVRISREQGRELEGVGKLYEKISRQQEQLGVTTRGVSLLTEGFAASLRLSGTNTQEANAAMLQFSQALASGRLGGDEFRSMMENNSVFMYELAKAADVTIGSLKDLSKDGKINLEFLRDALFKTGEDGQNALQRMRDKAAELPQTFGMAVAGVKTALADYLNALGQTATSTEGILARIARWVGDNLQVAAMQARARAVMELERARAMGTVTEEMEKAAKRLTPQQRYEEEVVQMRKDAVRQMAMIADRERIIEQRRLKDTDDYVKNTVIMKKKLQGELNGIQRLLTEAEEKDTELSSTNFLNPSWRAPTPTPKTPKGRKTKPDDPLGDLMKDIQKEKRSIEYELKEIGEWEGKLLEAILKAGKSAMTASSQALIQQMRVETKALDAAEKEKEEIKKAMKSVDDLIQGAIRKANEDATKLEQVQDRLDKILGRNDPFKKAELANADLRQLRDSLPDNILTPELWADFSAAMKKNTENAAREFMGPAKEIESIAAQMSNHFVDSFGRMTDSLLDFNKSGKELVADFVTDMLKQWARLEMKQAFAGAMSGGKGMIGGLVNFVQGLFGSADGNAFVGGVRMMANGGILNGPTYLGQSPDGTHNVGGEAGAEAVMPLQRDNQGKLGLAATPVTVNIYNQASGTRATATETTNSDGEREITILVERVVEDALSTGKYDKVLGHSFGVSRVGRG